MNEWHFRNQDERKFLENIDTVITPVFTRLTWFIFNYDDQWINEDLFRTFLEINLSEYWDINSYITHAKNKLQWKRANFDALNEALQWHWKSILWNKYEYLVENFKKIEVFYKLLELYIPVEAEKIDIFLSQWDSYFQNREEKILHIREIESLEEKIYWRKISDSTEYTQIAFDNIKELHQENLLLDERNKNKLTSEEDSFLEECLEKIEKETWPNLNLNDYFKEATWWIILSDPLLWIEWFDDSILQTEIPREKYVEIFRIALEILWLTDVKILLKEWITNISVSIHSINIPLSDDYKTLTIKRILELITHELEKHAIWNNNNWNLIWNLKSLAYLWQEEWAAHVFEKLWQWNDLDHIPLNRYLSRMLGWEILSGYEFKKFLTIMNKLDGEKINVETFFRRFKRWKDFQLPWVNPKEKMYWIWALEIIQRLKKEENPLWFFLAKNWSDEQNQVNQMVLWDESLTPQNLDNKGIILPILLWELLRYKLLKTDEDNKWMLWWFLKHFKDRYWGLFNALGISTQDFITNTISQNKNETRNNVAKILEIFHSEI